MSFNVFQDIRALAKDGKEAQVSADSVENDLTHWKAWLKGPEGTPCARPVSWNWEAAGCRYSGGLFDIDIEIPAEYPCLFETLFGRRKVQSPKDEV